MVLDETDSDIEPAGVKRIVLCSGKIYYDLRAKRREEGIKDVVIIRLEQLYPFPKDLLHAVLKQYKHYEEVVWCQEEPQNMGAWFPSQHHMENVIRRKHPNIELIYAGRPASAAPAGGYMELHMKRQDLIVRQALGIVEADQEFELEIG